MKKHWSISDEGILGELIKLVGTIVKKMLKLILTVDEVEEKVKKTWNWVQMRGATDCQKLKKCNFCWNGNLKWLECTAKGILMPKCLILDKMSTKKHFEISNIPRKIS